MNILFDINHPVDINFFKKTIKETAAAGHRVILTYRDRGALGPIIRHELGAFNPIRVGRHYTRFITKLVGQLRRDLAFLPLQRKNKVGLSVCFGPTNAISSWLNRIPYLAFDDDSEYKIPFYHASLFATRHIMPSYIEVKRKNIHYYRGFKELAYLHPACFTPNRDALRTYGLEPGGYAFVRKVAGVSLNYKNNDDLDIRVVKKIRSLGLKVLLSLEDKRLRGDYEHDCLILREPVGDIFSLIKFAALTVTSGDSVARESCLLGTPTIYAGRREMAVNKQLIELGCLFKDDTLQDILQRIDFLSSQPTREKIEQQIQWHIENSWDDTTEVILRHIKEFTG
jgi:predicted glycosyltransferase